MQITIFYTSQYVHALTPAGKNVQHISADFFSHTRGVRTSEQRLLQVGRSRCSNRQVLATSLRLH
ncbi:hypothetical protein [secondary endosymbiont of Ctenarytaina eucalypti]|uniref:Uncharacterized protein n=1 Tax=secondary endosymbiont of Ctenarytaina eucalypti TaxID=1199245 RepID=J3Z314_9ENTR|nr:hypothetical protein [secondary endosymbiont of Ctenarytaina eucalypti]AFP84614.1 hypothetical protein A359_02130 [secondary endosymbiont of Ctenarytaina eucalypti]